MSDPDEQCREFLNMVVTSRKEFENNTLTTAESSYHTTTAASSVYSNSYDPCTSLKEDYSSKNMDLESDGIGKFLPSFTKDPSTFLFFGIF